MEKERTEEQKGDTPKFKKGVFCKALNALREGEKVTREGWSDKGMFLQLVEIEDWKLDLNNPLGEYPTLPFIVIKIAEDFIVPWSPSQTDILSNDWMSVE